jgi:thymidylate synthase
MSNFTDWYIDKLNEINEYGLLRSDKLSLVQQSFSTDLSVEGLPLLHLKPTPWRLAVREMLWFLSGSTDYSDLHNSGCTWWRPWAQQLTDQDLFAKTIRSLPVTAKQIPYLHHAPAFRRISDALRAKQFDSTRLYCNLWPSDEDLAEAILPPCALSYQVTVSSGKLNLSVYQRSADLVCGVPANVLQYAFLLTLYADIAGLSPGKLLFNFGDLHAYEQHVLQTEWLELLSDDRANKAKLLAKHKCAFSLSLIHI